MRGAGIALKGEPGCRHRESAFLIAKLLISRGRAIISHRKPFALPEVASVTESTPHLLADPKLSGYGSAGTYAASGHSIPQFPRRPPPCLQLGDCRERQASVPTKAVPNHKASRILQ